jgi:hypothetical protein
VDLRPRVEGLHHLVSEPDFVYFMQREKEEKEYYDTHHLVSEPDFVYFR